MDLLDKLDRVKKQQILNFAKAHRHDAEPDDMDKMEWTRECMELVRDTPLRNSEKRTLVLAIYAELSAFPSNGFSGSFKIGKAIEFVWDTSQNVYGFRAEKKGFLKSCMPCCSSIEMVYDVDDNVMMVETKPLENPHELDVDFDKKEPTDTTGGDQTTINQTQVTQVSSEKNSDQVKQSDDDIIIKVENAESAGPVTVNLHVEKGDDNQNQSS